MSIIGSVSTGDVPARAGGRERVMGKMTRRMAAGAAALAVAFAVLACLVPQAAYAKRVPVRSKISAYSWTELKGIADRISKAVMDKIRALR